jgi:hypothetical protein
MFPILAQIDIATPTALPPAVGTTVIIDTINPADYTRQIAMEGVQWWNIINQNDIISYVQLALLMFIIIAGVVFIIGALNGDSDTDV